MPEQYLDPHTLAPGARATGVCRRLRALAWMGHAPDEVAHAYGLGPEGEALFASLCNDGTMRRWERDDFPVDLWYAAALAYDDRSMTFGTDQQYRERARAAGWQPPLAWDDENLDKPRRGSSKNATDLDPALRNAFDHAAVIRRINGDHTVPMRPADLTEAVRVLHTRGLTDWTIADALGVWVRQVHRIRHALDLPAVKSDPPSTRNHVPGLFSRAKGRDPRNAIGRARDKARANAA